MVREGRFWILCPWIAAVVSFGGCYHRGEAPELIVLESFSDGNYAALNSHLGSSVCILGTLSVDSSGVYFQLRPMEDDGIITIGVSRVVLDITGDEASRNGVAHGERVRACGALRDATPFRECEDNYCKWYKLENADLR